MKIIIISLLILLGLLPLVQSQTVDSIKVEQTGEVIKINYKILNSNVYQIFRVTVFCSINGGLKSELKSLSGDFGDNVVGGRSGYMVLWDVLKDVDEVKSVDFSVRAELIKDDTPKSKNKTQLDWMNKKIYILPTFGGGTGNGIRLAYMGSWGVSGKYVFGTYDQNGLDKTPFFHTGIDLTKRLFSIGKGGFQMHLMAGISYGKLLLINNSGQGYFDNSASYEFGTILAIRRFLISYSAAKYNPTAKSGFKTQQEIYDGIGIGLRF